MPAGCSPRGAELHTPTLWLLRECGGQSDLGDGAMGGHQPERRQLGGPARQWEPPTPDMQLQPWLSGPRFH